MGSQSPLPSIEVLSAARSCGETILRLQGHGRDVSALVLELWTQVATSLGTDSNLQSRNVEHIVPYRDILLKASIILQKAFESSITDDGAKDGILDDWNFTHETADKFADGASLSDDEQQSRIQLWKASMARFTMTGTSGNLERNLRNGLRVLRVVPTTSTSCLECALDVGAKLGTAYKMHVTFNGLEGVSLLQVAISRLSGLLSDLSESDPRREQYQPILDDLFLKLINESAMYQTHFWETEEFSHLAQAIAWARQAWKGLKKSKSREARYRADEHLGVLYKHRYLHLGQFDDLQQAIRCTFSALRNWDPGVLPTSDLAEASRLALRLSYHNEIDLDQLGRSISGISDMDSSYEDGKTEPGLTRHIGSSHAFYLNVRSEISRIAHHRRCHFDHSSNDIDNAVTYSQRSCNHVGPQDPGRYEALVELTTALMTRFKSAMAHSDDLDRAIEAAATATGLAYDPIYTNPQNSPRRCQRYICTTLDVAADVLTARYLRDRNLRDLDEADNAAHCVSVSTHSLHPLRPYQVFSKLERCRLRLLHEDQKTLADSRLSNLWHRKSFRERLAIPALDNLPSTAALLSALAAVKSSCCEKSIARRKGPTIVIGNEPVYLDNFTGVAERGSYPLDLRFTYDTPQYLLESRARSSLDLKKHEIERLSGVLVDSGLDDSTSFKESITDPEDFFANLELLERATKASIARKDPKQTLTLGRIAIKLMNNIDLVAPEGGPRIEQARLVRRLPLLIAKELLIQGNEAWECVWALEAGKEATSRYEPRMLTSYWYKTVRLIRKADEINARLRLTTTEWQDQMRKDPSPQEKFQQSSEALLNAVKEFANTKELIPKRGNFENECLKQTETGPIVFLVPTKSLSFAILMSASKGAEVLQLPEASIDELQRRLNDTFHTLKECEETGIKGKVNPKLRKLLEWLWRAVVKPVVVKLNLKPDYSPDASLMLPILRWITFGAFAQAPLHAAGQQKGQRPAMLSQYAISSYLPSIRYATITRARYSSDSDISPNTLLMIGMPQTDTTPQGEQLAELDFDREREAITGALRDKFSTNYLITPEMGTLESLLTHVRLAHFTCHGLPHATDPLLSRLVIGRDAARPLTVASIRKMAIPGAKLAFVSACHSAVHRKAEAEAEASRTRKKGNETGDHSGEDADDDEEEPPIHLARALQLAGFPTVVGTLWHAYQDSAIEISGHFYRFVADRWNVQAQHSRRDMIMDGAFFARALHHALRHYQEDDEGANLWKTVDWAGWMCFSD